MPKDRNKPRGRTTAYGYFVVDEKEKHAKVFSFFEKRTD